MAYTVTITSTLKKDFKRCMKRSMDISLITKALDLLEETGRFLETGTHSDLFG